MRRDVEAASDAELVALLEERQPNGYGTRPAWLAATELGLRGDPACAPALIRALADKNHVCACAARALARLGSVEAVGPLVAVLQDNTRFWAPRRSAADALGSLRELASEALSALEASLDYPQTKQTWTEQCVESAHEAILRIEAARQGRAEWCERSGHACLHCEEGVLLRLPRSRDDVAALECSRCRRMYLQRAGEGVVDLDGPLWGALYPVIFAVDVRSEVGRVADLYRRSRTRRECRQLLAAVDQELARPTQKVTEIVRLKHRPSEEDARAYLKGLCAALRSSERE